STVGHRRRAGTGAAEPGQHARLRGAARARAPPCVTGAPRVGSSRAGPPEAAHRAVAGRGVALVEANAVNVLVAEVRMAEVERSAPSVEEAVEAALAELGMSEQETSIEVLQEPRSGFLGFAAQPAVVRVRAIQPEAPVLAATQGAAGEMDEVAAPDDEAIAEQTESAPEADAGLDDQADIGADFVEDLLERMG